MAVKFTLKKRKIIPLNLRSSIKENRYVDQSIQEEYDPNKKN